MATNEQIEELRHKMSALLMDTSEEKPIECWIPIEPEGTFGLSTNDMLKVGRVFQQPSEGIIWLRLLGDDDYIEFDDFIETYGYEVMESVYNELVEQLT